MDNQHRKISGYRELSEEDIRLMNRVKSLGPLIEEVIAEVQMHIDAQLEPIGLPLNEEQRAELSRLTRAEPDEWVGVARRQLQQGLMALTRAVAQPTFF